MFLLVTAVWNQLARLDANQRQPGMASSDMLQDENIKLILQVQADGFTLATTAGDRISIPKHNDAYDMETLSEKLKARRTAEPNRRDLVVAPEDGVHYADVVASMDLVAGAGFSEMTLSDGATL
jgi:biopolymer transport protein ExbD